MSGNQCKNVPFGKDKNRENTHHYNWQSYIKCLLLQELLLDYEKVRAILFTARRACNMIANADKTNRD